MFDSYCDKYENVNMKRDNGILEVTLHTRGGPLVFNGYVHEALVGAFRDIGDDPENHVIILTGTGNELCAHADAHGRQGHPRHWPVRVGAAELSSTADKARAGRSPWISAQEFK